MPRIRQQTDDIYLIIPLMFATSLTSLFIAYIFTYMRHSVFETSLHWTLDFFTIMHCNKARR
jgi:hypothetical protein